MTGSWEEGRVLDVLPEMMTLTAKTAVETMFSDALPSALLGAVLDDFSTVMEGIYQRVLLSPPLDKLLILGSHRYDQARARLRRIIGRVITDRQANGADRGDLLSTLLTARDPADNQGLSDTEIVDQVITFFLCIHAGCGCAPPHETSLIRRVGTFRCSVVASDIAVLRETLGPHAAFVDPRNPDDVAHCVAANGPP